MQELPQKKGPGSKVINVVAVILCIVLIPILIVNITLIVKSFVKPNEVPSFMGYKPFIVLSGSMEPEFYAGDLVLVREVQPEALKEGDVISFREGESVITHRVKEIITEGGQRRFLTKGDNNNVEDKIAVTENKLEGIYLFKASGLGNVAMFMQTPVGMLVFIALPLTSFILYDILRRYFQERKEKSKTRELEEELERAKEQLKSFKIDADK